MDKARLKQLAGLTKNMSPTLSKIAEDIYRLAESRAADASSEQQGYGFDRNAIMAQADKICIEIKAYLDFKLKNHKFQ